MSSLLSLHGIRHSLCLPLHLAQAFVEMLGRLHPGEAGCSDCTLRLFMQGKYHIAKSKTISSRKWIKWRHAIYNLCLSMNGGVEPKQNAAPVS